LRKNEREMKGIMRSLGKYARKKKLEKWMLKRRKWWCSTRERGRATREWVELTRKENRTSKRVQILGLHIQRKATDKIHMREIVRRANNNRREKMVEVISGGEWWCSRAW
jgi:hypothetical protein